MGTNASVWRPQLVDGQESAFCRRGISTTHAEEGRALDQRVRSAGAGHRTLGGANLAGIPLCVSRGTHRHGVGDGAGCVGGGGLAGAGFAARGDFDVHFCAIGASERWDGEGALADGRHGIAFIRNQDRTVRVVVAVKNGIADDDAAGFVGDRSAFTDGEENLAVSGIEFPLVVDLLARDHLDPAGTGVAGVQDESMTAVFLNAAIACGGYGNIATCADEHIP